jgi:hypothetical protein
MYLSVKRNKEEAEMEREFGKHVDLLARKLRRSQGEAVRSEGGVELHRFYRYNL